MKVCLIVNDGHSKDFLLKRLPKEWDVFVTQFGGRIAGRRFDLILLPFYNDDHHSGAKKAEIHDWMLHLETRLAIGGRVVDL